MKLIDATRRFGPAIAAVSVLLLGLGQSSVAAAQATDFESAISAFERQAARFPPPESAVVVTGSSTIRLWTRIRNDLAPLEVIPRGFGGSTAEDLDFYLDRVVLPYEPRAVVIYEGDHDLQVGMSPDHVIGYMTQVVQRIGTALPETRIYLISVKPSPKFWGLWPQAVALNQMIADLCDQTPRCTYIDTASALLGSDGRFVRAYYRSDRIHLNDTGYAIWSSVLEPALANGEGAFISLPELRGLGVGDAGTSGLLNSADGKIAMEGSGTGFNGASDGFFYAWTQLTGNGQVTARIATQSDTSGGPMAGVMLREQLTGGARHALAYVSPGAGAGMIVRTTIGAEAQQVSEPQLDAAAPYWLRLVRRSSTVICYRSANGISWQECGKVKLTSLKNKVYVGLAVSSADNQASAAATFDNVYVHGSFALPTP